MILPWQQKEWRQLWQAKQAERLPHALLFTGSSGIGKIQFAEHFACALLCQHVTEDGMPCMVCHACRLSCNKVHPNIRWVLPENTGQVIKIEQIRDLTEFVYHSSLQAGFRIIILNPANQLNRNAADAFLKTLEEPPLGTLILLISDQRTSLPATLLSRCQRVAFTQPQPDQALVWLQQQLASLSSAINPAFLLKLAQGAPLKALQFASNGTLSLRETLLQALCALGEKQGDPIVLATKMQDCDLLLLLDFLLIWLMDILRLQISNNNVLAKDAIINTDYVEQLIALTRCISIKMNLHFIEYVQKTQQQIATGIHLNQQLLMEALLIRWCSIATR